MSLARRSVRSSAYNVISQGLQVSVTFFRSVMLARILQPEVFGVYAFAQAIVTITGTLPSFGMGTAFTHRSPESEAGDAPGVYFTLVVVFSLVWAILVIGGTAYMLDYEQFWVTAVLVLVTVVSKFVEPIQTILAKQILFQRLAILGAISAVLTTVTGLLLAWNGAGVWSLLSIDITGVLILVVGFCVVRPVWRPRFVWSLPIARYFLRFGSRTFVAGLLVQVIDRIDDIWTGHFLGDAALGFYSRAYTFANYPRRVLASPVDSVALATYAEAKGDRRRLSKVFFRVNALMIRTGFLFAGALFLISPEFVRLFLGEKWLPMLNAFRLMIAYTALDPIKYTTGHLFLSIGVPGLLARTRLFQLLILAVGLVTLGPLYGIAGVALAATLMVVIGMGTMLWQARTFVDFSPIRLFAAPVLALVTGGLGAHGLVIAFDAAGSYWQTALIKFVAFVVVYFAVMFLIERRDLYALTQLVLRLLRERKSSEAAWYSVQEDSRT